MYTDTVKSRMPESVFGASFLTPVSAALETIVAGVADLDLSNTTSIKARALYLPFYLLGGIAFGMEAREKSLKMFNAHGHQWLHDSILGAAAGFALKFGIYYASGEPLNKCVAVAGLVSGVGAIAAPALTKGAEIFKECIGYDESERTPLWIRDTGYETKRYLAMGLVALTMAFTPLIYYANSSHKAVQATEHAR